jgi:DnaJ homolog subfamily A member 5
MRHICGSVVAGTQKCINSCLILLAIYRHSHITTGQSFGMAPLKQCLYAELNVSQTADDAEIRKAYRTAALASHPDKNRGSGEDGALERFKAIQHAYEVLSDPHERAWYDSHRFAILRGHDPAVEGDDSGEGTSAANATGVDILSYFTSAVYSGFGDGPDSFFGVYAEVFAALAAEEREAGASNASPSFGDADSEWSTVRDFYRLWDGFSSRKAFGYAGKWNLGEAPNREIRRAMERENKRERMTAKKEFNVLVQELVAFVKKRDVRVKARKAAEAEDKEERERLSREKQAREQAERRDRAADTRAQRDEAIDEDANALDDILAQVAIDDKIERKVGKARRRRKQHDSQADEDDNNIDGDDNESNVHDNDDGNASAENGVDLDEDFERNEGEENEEEEDGLYCFACRKIFRTPAQKLNHEKSKKHVAAAKRLQRLLDKEDAHFAASTPTVDAADVGSADDRIGDVFYDAKGDVEIHYLPAPKVNGEKLSLNNDHEPLAAVENDEPFTPGENDEFIASEEGGKSLVMEGAVESISLEEDDAAFAGLSKKAKKKRRQQMKAQAAFNLGFFAGPIIAFADDAISDQEEVSDADENESEGEVGAGKSSTTPEERKADRRQKRKLKRQDKAAAAERAGSGDPDTDTWKCNVCGSEFFTRNKLFVHVKQKGHALHAEPKGAGAQSSKHKAGKNV